MTSTGGIADLYLFYGQSTGNITQDHHVSGRNVSAPNKIIRDFQSIVGTPAYIPRWALGWHTGREELKNTTNLEYYINQYEN